MLRFSFFTLFLTSFSATAAPDLGYTPKVAVSGPTRLDWVFAVSNQSPLKPPGGILEDGYDSTKQSYDLFIPEKANLKKPMPAALFISAGDEPQDGRVYEPICRQQGFVFISVRGAGNNVPTPKRTRIILDCFDDVRRQIALDPDRTYVSGLSGGGRMACMIGFSLPEYFGGIMPMAAGGELREEPWLQHRAVDRLSVALMTGQNDFNRLEVEKLRGPWWKELGIRTKCWVQPNGGHSPATVGAFAEGLRFLEDGKEQRAALAKKYPATHVASNAAPDRQTAAKALLDEGKEKIKAKETTFAGLMLLKGVYQRWPDLDQAKEALKILGEFEKKADTSWEADDVAEQRRSLLAQARANSEYALGIPAGSRYEKQRPIIARNAIFFWEKVIKDSPDSEAAKEGKKRLVDLQKLLGVK